jgi:hypothetical protein
MLGKVVILQHGIKTSILIRLHQRTLTVTYVTLVHVQNDLHLSACILYLYIQRSKIDEV